MKKVLRIVLICVLTVSALGILIGCGSPADKVDSVLAPTESEITGGVTRYDFAVKMKFNIDEWTALNDGDREKYAKSGYEEGKKSLEASGQQQFSITGYSSDNSLLFMYDPNEKILLVYKDATLSDVKEYTVDEPYKK